MDISLISGQRSLQRCNRALVSLILMMSASSADVTGVRSWRGIGGNLTELGRRGAILIGTMVFAIIVVSGTWNNGDPIKVVIQGLLAGIVFGLGGLIIGNLLNTYLFNAARRQAIRHQMEQEIREQMAQEEAERVESEPKEAEVGEQELGV